MFELKQYVYYLSRWPIWNNIDFFDDVVIFWIFEFELNKTNEKAIKNNKN